MILKLLRLTLIISLGLSLFLSAFPITHAQNTPSPSHELRQIMTLGRGTAEKVTWSPDGSMIAVGGNAGIWLYTNMLEDIDHYPTNFIGTLEWTPDGKWLLNQTSTFESERRFNIFETQGFALNPVTEFGTVTTISWAIGNTRLVIQSLDSLTILDAQTYTPLLTVDNGQSIVWNTDRQELAIITPTDAQIYDMTTFAHIITIPQAMNIEWSPDHQKSPLNNFSLYQF